MKSYDVVIFGGGTAGCACAWNCAKFGLKTLLLEKNSYLGGAMTGALVIPIMKSGDNQINTDFYNELTKQMRAYSAQITYQGNQGWFNPQILKIVLENVLSTAGVEILYGFDTKILSPCNVTIDTNNIYKINSDKLSVYIEAKYYVDATGNCDFSKLINCEFLDDSQDFQPMSLRFIMSGVNLKTLGNWLLELDSDRNVTTVQEIDGGTHLSTAYTWDTDKHWALAPLFDKAVEFDELKDSDRNYFQIFTVAGTSDSVAFNCPRLVKRYNPNNIQDVSSALIEGRQAIFRISEFCKKYFKGFEKAYISDIADSVGVRVSRRIKGKYIYRIEDLRSGKKFEHPAVISNYPVDVHNAQKEASTLEMTGEYQLPIESLMSADYENLFVAGRCLSADYMAQGALRVQASCFSMGEAIAKYIARI
ncbi:FAD-dependent oxidoreductase [bacterium]|nr:FAD-dependent oxidoreductase [bacterium]